MDTYPALLDPVTNTDTTTTEDAAVSTVHRYPVTPQRPTTKARRPLSLHGCEFLDDFCEVGNLAINLADWTITWRGQHIDFSVSEVKIILALAERPGVCLTYREVYDAVRGPGFHVGEGPNGHRNASRTHIKRIRAKLRSLDPTFDQIETRPGFGYLWRTTDPTMARETSLAA